MSELQARQKRRGGGHPRAALVALAIASAALTWHAYAGAIPSVRSVTDVTAQSPVDPGPQVSAPPVSGAQQPVEPSRGSRDIGTIAIMTFAFVAVGLGAVLVDRRRRQGSSSSA